MFTSVYVLCLLAVEIAMALPLLLGIVPESLNATALFEELINNIVNVNNFHVTLGIIGFVASC